MPPTLKALLAARLDQLDAAERRVLERGAVEGEVFHRGAVQALAPEEPQVTPRLAALVRRELIRPDRAQFAGDDGFRFRHLLIRDAAYDALPKAFGPSCTSASRTGSSSAARSSSSWTRSSATTSSRPPATARSSGKPDADPGASAPASASPPRAGARAHAMTFAPRVRYWRARLPSTIVPTCTCWFTSPPSTSREPQSCYWMKPLSGRNSQVMSRTRRSRAQSLPR